MRLIVFFDLPVETAAQRKSYRQFRKFLIKDGYVMMQESVYSKMVIDGQSSERAMTQLRKNRPKSGLVQALKVTEKQFAGIVEIVGEKSSSAVVDSAARVVVL